MVDLVQRRRSSSSTFRWVCYCSVTVVLVLLLHHVVTIGQMTSPQGLYVSGHRTRLASAIVVAEVLPATPSSASSFTSSIRMGMSLSTFLSPNRHVPRLAFAPVPVELPTKADQEGRKTMSMDAFVSKSCPSLYQPYDPPRWMHKYDLVHSQVVK